MKISRTGIILNTEKYDECVSFYGELFDLKILFKENEGGFKLTCFEFQGSYLMIETGGIAKPKEKSMEESCTKLRFNVPDIEDALSTINLFGIDAEILRSEWGATINICDPDGNRIGIRDEATFICQLRS